MNNLDCYISSVPGEYESPSGQLFDWLRLIGMLLEFAGNAAGDEEFPQQAQQARAALHRIRKKSENSDLHLPIDYLRNKLKLSGFGMFLALLSCAPGYDSASPGVLSEVSGSQKPTLGLGLRLYRYLENIGPEALSLVSGPNCPERLLFSLEGDGSPGGRLGQWLRPAPLLYQLLEGSWTENVPLTMMTPGIEFLQPADLEQEESDSCVMQQIVTLLKSAREHQGRTIVLRGLQGCGRRTAVKRAAAKSKHALVLADAATLPREPGPAVQDVLLLAAASDAWLVLTGIRLDDKENPALTALISGAGRYLSACFVLIEEQLPLWLSLGEEALELAFPPDTMLGRRDIWSCFAVGYQLAPDVDIGLFANKLHYTAGNVRRILRRAAVSARANGRQVLTNEDIWSGVRLHNASETAGQNLSRVDCVFTWEDIVLPLESLEMMRDACERIHNAHTVNETWGFGKKLPYGRGLSILLYGPPGTGKTMSAQVMARELGLELYKVDLSQIVSKYIGETQKNLSEIFAFAQRTNCVLLFDEADALFTKRTEVKDSNDKHANTETAFLLQKIEEHSGVSILSTNLLSNFDAAFRRRFTCIIHIPTPDEVMRLLIWKKVFPPEVPVSSTLNFEKLAKELELTASAIKAIALDAAYRAAAQNTSVGFEQVRRAVQVEMQKQGTRMTDGELASLR